MEPEASGSNEGSILGLSKNFEAYFLEEIEHGEVLITEGNFEGGIDHLVKTIVECNDPNKLFRYLEATMPQEVTTMVYKKLIIYNQTMQKAKNTTGGPTQGSAASNVVAPKEPAETE